MNRTARIFNRVKPAYMPGLRSDTEEVDVTSFGKPGSANPDYPVPFHVEGTPPTDDFLLAHDTWERLGQPDRIRVTVEAA